MKPNLEIVAGWTAMLAALAVGAHEARAIVSPIELTAGIDTVTYADQRIVYTVGTDTATVNGQLRRLPILTDAPTGARFIVFWKQPDYDSVMLLTGDTFSMSPTDSATARSRAIAWGVPDPYVITLAWHVPDSIVDPPDPVTNMTLVMVFDTLTADWTESADSYDVRGGLNAGPAEDYTDSITAPPNQQQVAIFGSYWTCVRAFNVAGLSDSRCKNVTYIDTGVPPTGNHEPPGMLEMFANNTNWSGDSMGPNNFSFLDSITHDPFGMRATPASMRFGFLTVGDPTTLGIGAPLPPSGSDSVLIGKWPNGFGDGSAPFSHSYERNWSGNPARASMYWSMQMFVDTAFKFNTNSTKMFWYSQNQNNNHFVTMHRNDTGTMFGIFLQFSDGPPDSEVSNNVQYAGTNPSNVPRGEWFTAEFLMVANSGDAVHDGKYRFWINGDLEVSHDTIYYFDSADSDKAFNIARWNPTWGGGGGPVPNDQYVLLDDWYVSTTDSLVTP